MWVWFRRALLVMALPLTILVLGGLWIALTVLTYSQNDDERRLASKEDYLKRIAASPRTSPNPEPSSTIRKVRLMFFSSSTTRIVAGMQRRLYHGVLSPTQRVIELTARDPWGVRCRAL